MPTISPAVNDKRMALAPALAAALALVSICDTAAACDGKSYSFNLTPGEIVAGGGLQVRLDRAKLLDDIPDKYYISVKDDGAVLADHVMLRQFDTLNFKTKCGSISIGANRKSVFSSGTLALTWSYF